MKVRICSGNQKGAVIDLPQIEAENALATGYAEAYVEPAEPEPVDISTVPVDEAKAMVAAATGLRQLNALEKAENAGKARVTVQRAIDDRREELKA